jgi:hypothetical protein
MPKYFSISLMVMKRSRMGRVTKSRRENPKSRMAAARSR